MSVPIANLDKVTPYFHEGTAYACFIGGVDHNMVVQGMLQCTGGECIGVVAL